MPAVPIKTTYGADVLRTFALYGLECDPDKDKMLFVIRDKDENVLYYNVLVPEYNQELQAWVFNLHITHEIAEGIPKGSFKYGLTLYKDAELHGDLPVNGTVVVPIARKAYVVKEAVAREEGIEIKIEEDSDGDIA